MAKNGEEKLKPVPRRAAAIVGALAKRKVVENLVQNVAHRSNLRGELSDLVQIIYLALLQTDPARLEHLATSGQMNFYIVRLITNQYFSETSPFYRENRRFGRRSSEISTQISETYSTDKMP